MKQPFSKIMILATVILMDILGGAEIDLFVPSFPELQKQFSLSAFWVEALLSVNFAGLCLSLLFVGGLADRYGRKPVILIGTIIFIIGSILCVWAPTYNFLLTGRFLQGLGVAAPSILCFLIIADTYPLKEQQYLMAILNGIMNISVAVAPIAGSYITMYFSWRGNFMMLLLLGLLTLVMTMLFVPTSKLPEHKESLSLRGYVPIFQSKSLMLLIVAIIFMFSPYWIFTGIAPILYMEDLGVSLLQFGYYQGTLALVFALGSILSGSFINKYDQKKMLFISSMICLVSVIGIGLVSFLNIPSPLLITLVFLPFIVGAVVPSATIYPLCLNFMPKAKGRVSAVVKGTLLIQTAVGLELAGHYYAGSFRNLGIILAVFILIGVIALFFVIRNRELMEFSQEG